MLRGASNARGRRGYSQSLALALALMLHACRHEFPEAPRGDLDLSRDMALLDRSTSEPSRELGRAPDAPARDLRPDVSKRPDVLPADTTVADQSPHPCKTGTGLILAPKMAVCELTVSVNQCDAAVMCGVGWHLCTSDDYAKIYPQAGSAPPQEASGAWMAGCIASGGSPGTLKPSACTGCTPSCTSMPATVATSCAAGNTVTNTCEWIGLVVSSTCYSVGTGAAPGWWVPIATSATKPRILCCF